MAHSLLRDVSAFGQHKHIESVSQKLLVDTAALLTVLHVLLLLISMFEVLYDRALNRAPRNASINTGDRRLRLGLGHPIESFYN